jgi:hypothetical protein
MSFSLPQGKNVSHIESSNFQHKERHFHNVKMAQAT